MKKLMMGIGLLLLVGIGIKLGCGEYRKYQTASDMSTDEENIVITGMYDSEHLERYKYLAIPDADMEVKALDVKRPYAKVTDIGESAFEGNVYLESVYIPVNIVRIRRNAFKGCTSIQSVSYAGTERQWKQIVIAEGNKALMGLSMEYNAAMPKSKDE